MRHLRGRIAWARLTIARSRGWRRHLGSGPSQGCTFASTSMRSAGDVYLTDASAASSQSVWAREPDTKGATAMSMSDSLHEGARAMPQHVPRRMRRPVVGTVSTAAELLVMAALALWLSPSLAGFRPR